MLRQFRLNILRTKEMFSRTYKVMVRCRDKKILVNMSNRLNVSSQDDVGAFLLQPKQPHFQDLSLPGRGERDPGNEVAAYSVQVSCTSIPWLLLQCLCRRLANKWPSIL